MPSSTPSTPIAQPTPHRVIFDTDPGVDDAMALYYALAHPGIELLGITTVFGNVTVQQATANALYLTQLTGHTVPVAQGAHCPLVKQAKAPPAEIQGADGLGNLPSRSPCTRSAEARSAAQFIVDMARQHPGEITLVPVGPLTNIALALELEPQLPRLVKRIVLMGGSIAAPGNVSPVTEANMWNDPHAADRVLGAGFDLTMVGLDVTYSVLLPVTLFEQIAAHHQHRATDALLHAVRYYAQFYASRFAHISGFSGCYGHDVMAFVCLTHPELFGYERGPTRVVTDGIAQGHSIMKRQSFMRYPHTDWDAGLLPISACMTVDAAAAIAELKTTLLRAWL